MSEKIDVFPIETRLLRWLRQGGVALISVFVFGIVYAIPAMSFGIVLPTKSGLPDRAQIIGIDDIGDAKELYRINSTRREYQVRDGFVASEPKSEFPAADLHCGRDLFDREFQIGIQHLIFGVNQPRADLLYMPYAVSGIDITKFNRCRLVNIGTMAKLEAMQLDPWPMGRNEFFAGQINLVSEKIVLSSGSPPECAGETSDCDSRERGESTSIVIRGFDDLPEEGKRDVIGGALFCIGIFILAAIFAVYGDKKRNRHGYSNYEKKSHHDDDDEPMS
jgi:hypothetical protein